MYQLTEVVPLVSILFPSNGIHSDSILEPIHILLIWWTAYYECNAVEETDIFIIAMKPNTAIEERVCIYLEYSTTVLKVICSEQKILFRAASVDREYRRWLSVGRRTTDLL